MQDKGGSMIVKDLMTKDVVTVSPVMSVHDLAELLIEKDISGAPVVDEDGKLVGIVQEESIIFHDKKVHLPTFINLSMGFLTLGIHRLEEEIKKVTAIKIADIMQKEPLVVSPQMPIEDLATLMVEKRVYYFPVVENEKLVGVVTKKDIVRSIAQE